MAGPSPAPVLDRAILDRLHATLGTERARAVVALVRCEMHRRVDAILRGIDMPPRVAREADALGAAARSVGLVALGAAADHLAAAARQGHGDALVEAIEALARAVREAQGALGEAGYSATSDSPAAGPSPQDARLR